MSANAILAHTSAAQMAQPYGLSAVGTPSAWQAYQTEAHKAHKAEQRLFRTDLPMALSLIGGSLLWMQHKDPQQRIHARFKQLLTNRNDALNLVHFLETKGFDAETGSGLIEAKSFDTLSRLKDAFENVLAPEKVSPISQELLAENPSSSFVTRISQHLSQYSTAFKALRKERQPLADMITPKVAEVLGLSVGKARQLAQGDPSKLVTRLFSNALNTRKIDSQKFFTRLFGQLGRTNQLKTQFVVGLIAVLFIGSFVVRMEMANKGMHQYKKGMQS